MDRSRGLRHVRPHLHRAEGRGPEGGDHRDVERVTPASDQDPTNTASVVAGVERPPATAEPHLHPRGKVHRVGGVGCGRARGTWSTEACGAAAASGSGSSGTATTVV